LGIPSLKHLFAETTMTGARAVVRPTAVSLANEMMEEIKARKFDERSAKDASSNWSTSLGPDSGESVKSGFDDVDDFNGYTQSFPGYTGYTATVNVGYVTTANINAVIAIPSPATNGCTSSYKLITVTISNAALPANYVLKTLVTEVQSL
jgi:hypothetical protein